MKNQKKITPKEINGWLLPWPVYPDQNREWEFNIFPLKEVLGWKNPNKLPNLGRITFQQIGKLMHGGVLNGLQDHYIKILSIDWVPIAKALVILMIEKDGQKIVFEGSHRLSAIAYAMEENRPIKMTHIGVLTPKKKKAANKKRDSKDFSKKKK